MSDDDSESSEAAIRDAFVRLESAIPSPVRARLEDWLAAMFAATSATDDSPQLDSYVRNLWSLFDNYTPSPDLDQRLSIAHGWWTIVNRQALAVATLHQAGMASESIPIARSLFEHSMALTVLSKDASDLASGVTASTFADFQAGLKALSNAPQGGYSPVDVSQLVATLEAMQFDLSVPSEDEWPRRFSEHVRRLGVKDITYPFYQGLCTFSHPTLAGVLGFVNWQDRFTPTKAPNNWILHGPAGVPLLWAVQSQCWAALAVDSMLPTALPWRPEVIGVVRDLDIPLADDLFGPLE